MGRSPILTLGPSWPYTLILLGLAAFILVFFLLLLSIAQTNDTYLRFITYAGICLNLLSLFGGILWNPGMPQAIIDRKLKEQLGKGENDGSSEEEDLELQQPTIRRTKQGWCHVCQIECKLPTYHCTDCEVCIENWDHHCVFFSKCIGGGNIYCFWGTFVFLGVNFFTIFCLIMSLGTRPK